MSLRGEIVEVARKRKSAPIVLDGHGHNPALVRQADRHLPRLGVFGGIGQRLLRHAIEIDGHIARQGWERGAMRRQVEADRHAALRRPIFGQGTEGGGQPQRIEHGRAQFGANPAQFVQQAAHLDAHFIQPGRVPHLRGEQSELHVESDQRLERPVVQVARQAGAFLLAGTQEAALRLGQRLAAGADLVQLRAQGFDQENVAEGDLGLAGERIQDAAVGIGQFVAVAVRADAPERARFSLKGQAELRAGRGLGWPGFFVKMQIAALQLHQDRDLAGERPAQLSALDATGQGAGRLLDHAGVIVPAAVEDAVNEALQGGLRPLESETHHQRQSRCGHHLGKPVSGREANDQEEGSQVQEENPQRERGVDQRAVEQAVNPEQVIAGYRSQITQRGDNDKGSHHPIGHSVG